MTGPAGNGSRRRWEPGSRSSGTITRTKGLTEAQNKQYAKDLKEFSKQEAEKFRNQKQEEESEN